MIRFDPRRLPVAITTATLVLPEQALPILDPDEVAAGRSPAAVTRQAYVRARSFRIRGAPLLHVREVCFGVLRVPEAAAFPIAGSIRI